MDRVYYLIGIAFYGVVAIFAVRVSLHVLPIASLILMTVLPVVLFFKGRKVRVKDVSILSQGGSLIKRAVQQNKKNWSLFLVVGIVIGFAGDELARLILSVAVGLLVGLVCSFVLWTVIRKVAYELKRLDLPTYGEVMKVLVS